MPLSEFDIIEQIFRQSAGQGTNIVCGIGDDAAIIKVPHAHQLVVSTDTLVSGIHFFADTDPNDIGFKSLAVNLSDMAAMGAKPLWATLSLTLPDSEPDWIRQFADGFFYLAKKYGVDLVGGDLSQGPLSITVQIMGTVPDDQALRRSGAAAGDLIYVTGTLGMAALALSILKDEVPGIKLPPSICLERLNRPLPRVETGQALRGIASAAIDISDGLAADLGHLVEMSGTGARINLAAIPLCDESRQLDEATMWSHAITGGDDYELCFTVPVQNQQALNDLIRQDNCPLSCIGVMTEDRAIRWLTSEGIEKPLRGHGYRHF